MADDDSRSHTRTFCLVHGPRKAGTTLLQALLDTPDRVLMRPGELKLKRLYAPRVLDLDNCWEVFAAVSDIYNGRDTYIGDPGEHYRSMLETAGMRGANIDELVTLEAQMLRQKIAPGLKEDDSEVVAFKEVGGRLESVLQAARLLFPRLRVILITRHPMAVSSAIYRSRRQRGQIMTLRSLIQQAVEPWQVLRRQMAMAGAPRLCLVSYESLVKDPKLIAKRIEAFLELPEGSLNFDSTTQFGLPITSRTASRQTSEVFLKKDPWQRGLSRWEIILTICASAYFRVRFLQLHAIGRCRWVTYESFCSELDTFS